MMRYPERSAWEEIAYLAYHVHWSLDDLLDLSHRHRVRLIGLVANVDQHRREEASHG